MLTCLSGLIREQITNHTFSVLLSQAEKLGCMYGYRYKIRYIRETSIGAETASRYGEWPFGRQNARRLVLGRRPNSSFFALLGLKLFSKPKLTWKAFGSTGNTGIVT